MTGVSAILQQMAENAGRAQLARGQTYGSLVAQASQVPAQIMDDRDRQAALDFQRAREAQQMALATRADQRATLDQAYQDQTRAQEVEKQQKIRAILGAYTAGTPNDPSTNNLAAGVAKAREVGLPEWIPNLWELHKKEQEFTNPRPYETDPTKDQRSPLTNEILTPGQPKMPEIGTDAYERAVAIRNLTNPPGAGTAPGAPPGPASTYAGRVDLLQNGPPPSTVPAGGPGAPATTAALPPMTPGAPGAPATTTAPTAPAAILGAPPAAGASTRPLTVAEATAKVYTDQRAAVEAAKDPHSASYKEWKDYQAQGGALGFNDYMTADANRKKPVVSLSGLNTLYSETDPKAIAAAIMRGEREPDTSGLGRPIGAAVDSELAKQGYNKAAAITDWRATQKHIASMNGAQQLNLNQKINALPDLLDSVDTLASQWHGGRFPILNKANLALAKQGAYGEDVASLARQLDTQIADTTADLATVYMGGNSPTDHGLELAATALKGDWSEKVLHDMVKLGKANVTIRRNSINNTGVAGASATNPYAPPPVTPPPPPPPAVGGAPKEGDTQPIAGYPGTEQTYRGGRWIRTK